MHVICDIHFLIVSLIKLKVAEEHASTKKLLSTSTVGASHDQPASKYIAEGNLYACLVLEGHCLLQGVSDSFTSCL